MGKIFKNLKANLAAIPTPLNAFVNPIDVLVKNKLVRKLELGDGKALYENKVDAAHHDHMICVQCGKIEEFVNDDIEKIQDEIVKKFDYKMIRHIHQLFVLCDKCQ